MKRIPGRRPLESETQRALVALFMACGGIPYSTSQGYREDPGGTRCSPGIPDLYVFVPRRNLGFWWEVKRPSGKRTWAQIGFAQYCTACGIPYGWGGVEEAKSFLEYRGLMKGEDA